MQRLKSIALTALVCGCGAAAMSLPTGPKPAWVGNASAAYSDSEYLTAIGMTAVTADTQNLQQAVDAAARVELTKKIEVSVSSEFQSYQAESNVNGKTESTQSVSELSREAVEGMELEGVEIKERWLDEQANVAYALAVWHRVRAEALLKAKLTQLEDEAKKAESAVNEADPAISIKQLIVARNALERAANQAVLLRAITGKAVEVPDPSSARGKLDALVNRVDVAIEGGSGQRVTANKAAPQPLEVKATLDGKPLPGLPLRFSYTGGAIEPQATTNAQGIAQARISNVGPMPQEAAATAQVDWSALAAQGGKAAWAKALRPIELTFQLVPKNLSSTRVLVKIIERIEGADGTRTGAVQSAVSTHLSKIGFSVRDGAALTERIAEAELLTLDPKNFQKQARDLADVVIVGEAVSSESSTLSGKVVVHRARLNIRAVDLGTGEVVATASLEKKGQPGAGPEKAGKKALEALAGDLDATFASEIKTKLGF